MTIAFTKMQASGNDFILMQANDTSRMWTDLAKKMCNRRFGIGADGLLIVLPSEKADLRVRVFNSDGSEAEVCGNGLISLSKYAIKKGLVKADRGGFSVETGAGIKMLKLPDNETAGRIEVSMGNPEFLPEEIPVSIDLSMHGDSETQAILDYPITIDKYELKLTFISMGNPHAVHFTKKMLDVFPLSRLGPLVEHDPIFPQRVNFEVARIVDKSNIEARVWERGAGETFACGSGACAVAVAARLHGYVEEQVNISLPGGTLGVRWDKDGEVILNGTSEVTFTGKWKQEAKI